jgi:hypothetical protein
MRHLCVIWSHVNGRTIFPFALGTRRACGGLTHGQRAISHGQRAISHGQRAISQSPASNIRSWESRVTARLLALGSYADCSSAIAVNQADRKLLTARTWTECEKRSILDFRHRVLLQSGLDIGCRHPLPLDIANNSVMSTCPLYVYHIVHLERFCQGNTVSTVTILGYLL